MKIYDGGSHKDELLFAVNGNSVTFLGNQMFISFTTDGNVVGFTAKITFGNRIIL